ncbi:MAG: hypothetical protein E7430_09895 [Ruminococcaceae bacterium]|nr:hypothetical protein [Oscillospiraceae bacterium]
MTAADRLLRLLVPLGVYSFGDGTYSLGEIKAVGRGADTAKEDLGLLEKNCCLLTASEETLRMYARLFGFALPADGLRQAIPGLLNISGDGFTPDAINAAIAACGINARVSEKGGGVLTVRFPGVMGVPEGFELMAAMIENIMPAHLETEYAFLYLTWQQAAGITWQQAGAYTWDEFAMLEM